MKDMIIYVYSGKDYVMGFDYASIKNVQMGIDSKLKYYEMDKEIKDFIVKNNLNVIRTTLTDRDAIRIKTEYYNELEDVRNRIKNATLSDLLSWKKSLEERKNTEIFNEITYKSLENEILERENVNNKREEVLENMITYFEMLKDEYGNDLINSCLKELPERLNKRRKSA